MAHLKTGDILNKKYILVKQIGSGQFSSVWLGLNYDLLTYVAIKSFENDNINIGMNEIEILNSIMKKKCPNCISYLEHFKFKNVLFIVQELMAGSLYSIMKSQYPNGFPLNVVQKMSKELLIALSSIHKNKLIHGDLKPENILVVGRSIEVENIIKRIDLPNRPNSNIPKSKNGNSSTRTKNTLKRNCANKNALNKNTLSIDVVASNIKKIILDMSAKTDGSKSGKTSSNTSDDDSYCGDSENSEDSENYCDTNSIHTDSDIASSHDSTVDRKFLVSDSDDSDNEIIYEKKISHVINKKYIDDPHIVLADFGNCLDIKTADLHRYSDIQTRHYRSPEIILRLDINEKTDIWAFGCTIFELVTGKLLFNPKKTNNITCDQMHIYDIICLFGMFPQNFYECRKKNIFFDTNNLLLKFNDIHMISLLEMLTSNLHDVNQSDINELHDFLKNTFIYDIPTRYDATKLLEHKFIS